MRQQPENSMGQSDYFSNTGGIPTNFNMSQMIQLHEKAIAGGGGAVFQRNQGFDYPKN